MPNILVVIPTYNEAENIVRLIPAVIRQGPGIEVLVVDDGSPDGTGAIVAGIMKRDPTDPPARAGGEDGPRDRVCRGVPVRDRAGYDLVFEMDADFSHDPEEIPKFLDKAATADLVIGSRYMKGVRVLNWPMQRLLLSYFANVYTRFMTGLPLTDATGGFKCYRRAVLEAIDLSSIRSNGYAFQIEMSFKAWKKGFRLLEIPIVFLDRRSGSSKMSKHIISRSVLHALEAPLQQPVPVILRSAWARTPSADGSLRHHRQLQRPPVPGERAASIRRAMEDIDGEIFVVDNASNDGSAEMVRAKFPDVPAREHARTSGSPGPTISR